MKTKLNPIKIIIFLLVLFNSGVFLLYGTAKLIGLQLEYHQPRADLLLKDTRAVHIMWYFFSLKKGYSVLIALSELVPAVLILFKRTRLFGSILYLFTAINILAINIFFVVTPQTLILSIIIFINILTVLFSENKKLKALFS